MKLTKKDIGFIQQNIASPYASLMSQEWNIESTLKVLKEALKTIESDGWTKGAFTNEKGQVCAVGAIRVGALKKNAQQWGALDILTHTIEPQYRFGSQNVVTDFNDKRGINSSHVKAKFRQAINMLEAYKEYLASRD